MRGLASSAVYRRSSVVHHPYNRNQQNTMDRINPLPDSTRQTMSQCHSVTVTLDPAYRQ